MTTQSEWQRELTHIQIYHRLSGTGAQWRLTAHGIQVAGESEPRRTKGDPATARRVLQWFGPGIRNAADRFNVPMELIMATICTEAAGGVADRDAVCTARREEPGFVSDTATPGRVSLGCMQTLISTASEALGRPLTAEQLCDPAIAIEAGTAYIAKQFKVTRYDPVFVAAAYNAGSLIVEMSHNNPWRLRCYPLGTGEHITRFAAWFGDAMAVLAAQPSQGAPCFAAVVQ